MACGGCTERLINDVTLPLQPQAKDKLGNSKTGEEHFRFCSGFTPDDLNEKSDL